jgi:hypothetical protein
MHGYAVSICFLSIAFFLFISFLSLSPFQERSGSVRGNRHLHEALAQDISIVGPNLWNRSSLPIQRLQLGSRGHLNQPYEHVSLAGCGEAWLTLGRGLFVVLVGHDAEFVIEKL